MSESIQHQRLVIAARGFIADRCRDLYSFTMVDDLPARIGAEKPLRIGGFVPDIYAHDTPLTIAVLGEAKTAGDIENEHTRNQIVAYLKYLEQQPNGLLVVAVPWQCRGMMSNFIRLCRDGNHKRTELVILTDAG